MNTGRMAWKSEVDNSEYTNMRREAENQRKEMSSGVSREGSGEFYSVSVIATTRSNITPVLGVVWRMYAVVVELEGTGV